ncbi:surface lipoprotein assembly modifier [Ursidibacter sp. B-7004-1]
MKKSIFVLSSFSSIVYALPEQTQRIAEVDISSQSTPIMLESTQQSAHFIIQELQHNSELTHELLAKSLYGRNVDTIETLLSFYQKFPNKDEILVIFSQAKIAVLKGHYSEAITYYRQILATNPELTPVRIELAITLFYDNQNNVAEDQFLKALTAPDIPASVRRQIEIYLDTLKSRNKWRFNLSGYYLRENNINKASYNHNIENTGYVKNKDMLPKSANGFALNLGIAKDVNLFGKHYLTLDNDLSSKIYWDSHDYDEVINRLSLGYRYKTASSTFSLLPFYEKRWYGGKSYNWQNGVRLETSKWFTPHWQLITAIEWGKLRYFNSSFLNGYNKLFSSTLVWARTPKQFFYIGSDFNRESTRIKQYSSNTASLRLGWGQEWGWGISSNLGLSIATRKYKDQAVLGGLIPLGKVRRDKIYSANLVIWKRDLHIAGITPKLQLNYRKQRSNLPTMYSYSDKNINVIFERVF